MRIIYLAILVSTTISVFYFKGELLLDFFWEWNKPAVSKKVSAVKPKFLINKAEALKPVSHQFTFFETLNDKTMTKNQGNLTDINIAGINITCILDLWI